MQTTTFYYPIRIKEQHLDTFGHVNNATYLVLLEEARWDLMNKGGYSIKKIQESGIGPTILSITINFSRELLLHDEIIVETQTKSYNKKIGTIAQRMVRNGDICCTAEFVMGLFDLNTRKLILPTPEWLHVLGMTQQL